MFFDDFLRLTDDMAREGWAEANAGNLSIRLDGDALAQFPDRQCRGPWIPLAQPVPDLGGETLLVTAKGCQLRNVSHAPRRDCGLAELRADGGAYRPVWGFEGTAPTSELAAHLLSHQVRLRRSGGAERVILHTHPVTLIALCHVLEPDTRQLNRLLWGMHPEAVSLFPGGIAYLPFAIPGSAEIARATCEAFETYSMVLWEYHGIFASADTMDRAFGMVQAAEKAARIYQTACALGGVRRVLPDDAIAAVAASLRLTPVAGILDGEDGHGA